MFRTHQRAEPTGQIVSGIRKYASKERQPVRPGWPAGTHGGKGQGCQTHWQETFSSVSDTFLTSSAGWSEGTVSLEPQTQRESGLASRLLSSRLSRSQKEDLGRVGRWELTSCWIRPWWGKQQPQKERNKAPGTLSSPTSLLSKDLTTEGGQRAPGTQARWTSLHPGHKKHPSAPEQRQAAEVFPLVGGGSPRMPLTSRGGCPWPDTKAEQEREPLHPHPAPTEQWVMSRISYFWRRDKTRRDFLWWGNVQRSLNPKVKQNHWEKTPLWLNPPTGAKQNNIEET